AVPRISGRQPVPRAQHRLGDAGVSGVRGLRQHTAASRTDVAAAMEPDVAAADGRLARLRELSGKALDPSVACDGTQPGSLRSGCDDRKHESAAGPLSREPAAGTVLRD